MSIWKYYKWLPDIDRQYRLSRGEGRTSLIRSTTIGRRLGLDNLYFKLENLNPTGSYKDRFAAVTVSRLLQTNQKICLSTSSGNTGAALAAYCAAAGIRCVVMTVEGAPADKLLQMQAFGAEVNEIKGFGIDTTITAEVFDALNNYTTKSGMPLPVSAYKFYEEGMEGVETIAYEILEELPAHHIFSPAGGGGLTLAIARGSNRYTYEALMPVSPRVHCVQPEGNDTIAGPLKNNEKEARKLRLSTTTISGLQVPDVLDGNEVINACRSSGGSGVIVKDEEVFKWQSELAQTEGIFCEPAGAVALAGVAKAVAERAIDPVENVVCLITGSGFKNLKAVSENFLLSPQKKLDVRGLKEMLCSREYQIQQ